MYKAWFLVRHFFLSPLLEVKWLVKKKSSKMAAEPGTEARNLLLLSSPLLILPFFLHTSHCHHGEWLLRTRWSTSSKRTAISWCHNVLYSMGCLTLPLFCCAYFSDQNEKQKVFWSLLRWPGVLTDALSSPTLVPIRINSKTPVEKSWAEGTPAESPTMTLCRTLTACRQSVTAQMCILGKDSSTADFPWAESIASTQVLCCLINTA